MHDGAGIEPAQLALKERRAVDCFGQQGAERLARDLDGAEASKVLGHELAVEQVEAAGAIVHVRLARVVFGASDPKAGAAGTALNLLQFPGLNHRCEITAGVREPECRGLLQTFFAEQRAKAQFEEQGHNPATQGGNGKPGSSSVD